MVEICNASYLLDLQASDMKNTRDIVLTPTSTEDDIKIMLGEPLNARNDVINMIQRRDVQPLQVCHQTKS